MKFNFGKIGAIASSLAVVGVTAGMAAAAEYPNPFVVGGNPDVAIIYGESGNDLGSVSTIESDLESSLGEGGGGAAGGVPTGGDYVLLAKSSNNLNLGDTVSGPFGITVDDLDLPELLADGTYTADDNDDFQYTQKLTLGTWDFTHFRDSAYEEELDLDDKTPTLGFDINTNEFVVNYTIEFISEPESDVVSGDLDDIEGSDLPLFGQNYFISDAKNGTSETVFGTWTLLDSAGTDIVNQDETVSLEVNGITYDVTLVFVDSTEAKFEVNGDLTNDIAVGQSEKLDLPGEPYISVRDIDYQSESGGTKKAEFSIGAGKLELFSDGSEIELNDESVDGLRAYIYKGTYNGAIAKVDKIVINWIAEDKEFLTPAKSLTMPGFGQIKFLMNEFARPAEEELRLEDDADTSFSITVPLKDGDANINLLGANESGEFNIIGKDSDERLATSSTGTLTYYERKSGDDFHVQFVASYNTSSDSESYLLKVDIEEDTSSNRNETTITNVLDTTQKCEDRAAGDDCTIGDVSFDITSVDKNSTDRWMVITAGTDTHFNTLYTVGGLRVYLPVELNGTAAASFPGGIDTVVNLAAAESGEQAAAGVGHNKDKWWLFMDEEDKEDNLGSGLSFNFTVDDTSDGDIEVSQVNGAGSGGSAGLEIADTKEFVTYMVSDVATKIMHYTDPDQDYAEVYYPASSNGDSESYAEVFVADDDATLGDPVLGTVRFMDTESLPAKNLIVVGGTCVNKVATMLLGMSGDYVCGDDYLADEMRHAEITGDGTWVIETYEHPDFSAKIATLVYGWAQADTGSAANYLVGDNGVETEVGQMYSSA